MGILAIIGASVYSAPPLTGGGGPTSDALLLENADFLLLESGDYILLG